VSVPMIPISSKRLEFFSDAVLAVAITLMVLRISPPIVSGGETLGEAFWSDTVPQIIYFLVTFAIIVSFWVGHHDVFAKMGPEASRRVLFANMAFLALICLLPFGLEFFSDEPSSILTTAVYAGLLALSSLAMTWLQWVAVDDHSLDGIGRAVVFLLAIPLAPLLGGFSPLIWVLNWPVSNYFDRKYPGGRRA